MNETTFQSYRIGASAHLSEEKLSILISHLKAVRISNNSVLGGRGRPIHFNFAEAGPVTVKNYLRGGVIRHLIRQTHFRWGPTRPQTEFNMLIKVRRIGISAPKPVAYITKGGWLYQGWLVTRRINDVCTLVKLAQNDHSRTKNALANLKDQVSLLIEHRLLHTDLHPGNVLVDKRDQVYIVDFDKTRTGISDPKILVRRYNRRWRRAIAKYHLAQPLDKPIVT